MAFLGIVDHRAVAHRLRAWHAVQPRHHDPARYASESCWPASCYGLVIALSAGTLMLALSSLSRNSRYVALLWLGVWFVSGDGFHNPCPDRSASASVTRCTDWRAPGRRSAEFLTPGARSGQDRLAAARFLHRESLPDRQPAARYRRRVGADRCNLVPQMQRAVLTLQQKSRLRTIPGIGRPPSWPSYSDSPHAF